MPSDFEAKISTGLCGYGQ